MQVSCCNKRTQQLSITLHCNITLNSAHVPLAENSINSFLRNEYVPLLIMHKHHQILARTRHTLHGCRNIAGQV